MKNSISMEHRTGTTKTQNENDYASYLETLESDIEWPVLERGKEDGTQDRF